MSYQVKIENFEGPLDLLLHMIRKNELDIYNIPVAEIANQYLEYVEVMQALNLDGVGDFLVMAAALTYYKSKMLLPTSENEEEEDDDFESLEALHQRLIQYQRFKEAAQSLGERDVLNRDVFHVHVAKDETGQEVPEPKLNASLFDLLDAFHEIIKQVPKESIHEIIPERIHLVDRIVDVLDIIKTNRSIAFDKLFQETPSLEMMLVTFLSILELVRMQLVHAYQSSAFGSVQLKVAAGEEDQEEKLKQALASYES